jgi:hypothetical protein
MAEVLSYGWQIQGDRDNPEAGYTWEVYVETAERKHVRATTELKPHKQAVRNAKAAQRRLLRKVEERY